MWCLAGYSYRPPCFIQYQKRTIYINIIFNTSAKPSHPPCDEAATYRKFLPRLLADFTLYIEYRFIRWVRWSGSVAARPGTLFFTVSGFINFPRGWRAKLDSLCLARRPSRGDSGTCGGGGGGGVFLGRRVVGSGSRRLTLINGKSCTGTNGDRRRNPNLNDRRPSVVY